MQVFSAAEHDFMPGVGGGDNNCFQSVTGATSVCLGSAISSVSHTELSWLDATVTHYPEVVLQDRPVSVLTLVKEKKSDAEQWLLLLMIL